jgi:hypothetical protein
MSLTAGRLLGLGAGAARRQSWGVIPLFVAGVLARLLGFIPTIVLAARFLRNGLTEGADNPAIALILGALTDPDPLAWIPMTMTGAALAAACGWLIGTVVEAGALRLLAAQAGRQDVVPDESFSEGVLGEPEKYLSTAALAALLKIVLLVCVVGAFVSSMNVFAQRPGALAALLMTLTILLAVLAPQIAAALDVALARAVIRLEMPGTALGEALLLCGRHAAAFLPAWWLIALVQLGVVFIVGFLRLAVSALPTGNDLWILQLGPAAMVALLALGATTVVDYWRLGMFAALVAEDAGTLPAPAEPVFAAVAVLPSEPVYTARAVLAEDVPAPDAGASEPPPDETPGN